MVRLRPRLWEELTAFSAGASIACFAAMIDLAGSVVLASVTSATTGILLLLASDAKEPAKEPGPRRTFDLPALGRRRSSARGRS